METANKIIASADVDITTESALVTFLNVTVNVFQDRSVVLGLNASTISASVHTNEERLLAVAEALQRAVAEARRRRAEDATPACCVGGVCCEHAPIEVTP